MIKVLVVDDETLVRQGIVMETDWSSLDCTVIAEASNGLEGLDAIKKYSPDLIICDIRMPKMDGLEMLQKMRAEGNTTPVIFLTAYSDFSYAQQAIKLSATDYLLKPFEDGDLEKAITRVTTRISRDRRNQRAMHEADVLSDELIEKKGDKSKYVAEALSYIAEHYGDEDLGIKTVAESIGISEGHLSHVFKAETDYTVNAFITRYRIKAAMKLLSDVRYKVYEVAEKVGYKDITYFSSVFKKITGLNPSDFQNRIHSS
ncbi:MAG: response regulator [Lachnospiraceae bacterium]|nr:response regulator [Lachnospiraceae bacterium]